MIPKGKCCLSMVATIHAVRGRVGSYGPINTTVEQLYFRAGHMCGLWLARWWSCCPETSAAISWVLPPGRSSGRVADTEATHSGSSPSGFMRSVWQDSAEIVTMSLWPCVCGVLLCRNETEPQRQTSVVCSLIKFGLPSSLCLSQDCYRSPGDALS